MRGLIYKEFCCFYRGIDKKLIMIAAAAMALLLYKAGSYGGMMASVMLGITVGMQNCMCIAGDEKAGWKRYQMAMPVGSFQAVVGKYVSVLCTAGISLAGSIAFSLVSGIVVGGFDVSICVLSAMAAAIVPVLWTGICLPLTYGFGIQSAQTMGLLAMVPIFYLIKYFEDGPGFAVMAESFYPWLPVACIAAVVLFGLSLLISAAGYGRKK